MRPLRSSRQGPIASSCDQRMGIPDSPLMPLRACARPVVFETGLSTTPFSMAGTAFLVGFDRKIFIVTARHVVREHPPDRLLIFPTDGAPKPLTISQWWRIEDEEDEPDDSDLLLIQATVKGLSSALRRRSQLIHLTPPDASRWFPLRYTSRFFTFGFPTHLGSVDYDGKNIKPEQVFLEGNYSDAATTGNHVHAIRVRNPLALPSFDGLSGSPVFSLENVIGRGGPPTFCGMALRGGTGAGVVHFLDAAVIMRALLSACHYLRPAC